MADSIGADLEKSQDHRNASYEDHEEHEGSSMEHHASSSSGDSQIPNEHENGTPLQHTQSRLSRVGSIGLERANSALSTIRSRKPIPPFNHPLTHQKTDIDSIVDFDGPDDPYRPVNWTFNKKIWTTALYGFTTMGSTFASSVFSLSLIHI